MFLGIDLGTSSVKALLVDGGGQVLAEASRPYQVSSPQPGWAETAPEDWWRSCVEAVREACGGQSQNVQAIGFSGQAHGLVAVDASGAVLAPAILWPDRRAEAELAQLLALPEDIRLPLANPVVPGMMALALMWLRANRPDVFGRLHLAFSPKDWLRYKMTGQAATEPTDASMTLLWDMGQERWSAPMLKVAGISAQQLPPLLASTAEAGRLGDAAATELALPAGIPLATGLSDCAACLLGMGLTEVGQTVLQIGSGIQIMSVAPKLPPRLQPFFNTYRGVGDSRYLMAAGLNGGTAFEWARGVLGASWEEMYASGFAEDAVSEVIGAGGASGDQDAAGTGNGAGSAKPSGVTFLPYVAGERAPLLDPEASAVWAGLRLGTSRAEMIRAVFEGVALAIADSWQALGREGAQAETVLLAGGGSRDPRWRQLLADTTGMHLRPAGDHGHAALGAAFCAGLMTGHWRSFADLPIPAAEAEVISPRPGQTGAALENFQNLYAALRRRR